MVHLETPEPVADPVRWELMVRRVGLGTLVRLDDPELGETLADQAPLEILEHLDLMERLGGRVAMDEPDDLVSGVHLYVLYEIDKIRLKFYNR